MLLTLISGNPTSDDFRIDRNCVSALAIVTVRHHQLTLAGHMIPKYHDSPGLQMSRDTQLNYVFHNAIFSVSINSCPTMSNPTCALCLPQCYYPRSPPQQLKCRSELTTARLRNSPASDSPTTMTIAAATAERQPTTAAVVTTSQEVTGVQRDNPHERHQGPEQDLLKTKSTNVKDSDLTNLVYGRGKATSPRQRGTTLVSLNRKGCKVLCFNCVGSSEAELNATTVHRYCQPLDLPFSVRESVTP